jgi:hypothetical protein
MHVAHLSHLPKLSLAATKEQKITSEVDERATESVPRSEERVVEADRLCGTNSCSEQGERDQVQWFGDNKGLFGVEESTQDSDQTDQQIATTQYLKYSLSCQVNRLEDRPAATNPLAIQLRAMLDHSVSSSRSDRRPTASLQSGQALALQPYLN